jgi:hypothetical protein
MDYFKEVEAILDIVDPTITNKENQIKQQLINARTFLLLYSLKKYSVGHDFLGKYWNSIPTIYKESIVFPNNIRIFNIYNTKLFEFGNIFVFIQSVERYKRCLFKDNIALKNYTVYLDELIYPMIQTIYKDFDIPLLKKLNSLPTLQKLHTLIQWEKNSFVQTNAQWCIEKLNENIKQQFASEHSTIIFNSKEYQHITDMMHKKESYYIERHEFSSKLGNTQKEEKIINVYDKIVSFMTKQKIDCPTIINTQQKISLIEHMQNLCITYILPYFEQHEQLVESKINYDDIKQNILKEDLNLLIDHLNEINCTIGLSLLERNFDDVYRWCNKNDFNLNEYFDSGVLTLSDIKNNDQSSMHIIINIIKKQFMQLYEGLQKNDSLCSIFMIDRNKDEVISTVNNLTDINNHTNWQEAESIFNHCINLLQKILLENAAILDYNIFIDNYFYVMVDNDIIAKHTIMWILAKEFDCIRHYDIYMEFVHQVTRLLVQNLITDNTVQQEHIESFYNTPEQMRTAAKHFLNPDNCRKYLNHITANLKARLCPDNFKVICKLYQLCKLPCLSQESMKKQKPNHYLFF